MAQRKAALLLAMLVVALAARAAAQTPTILFNFDVTHGDSPYGGLTLSGSTLYGMTADGGTSGLDDGTIFSIPVTGGTPTTLFSFDNTHGAYPSGDLILSGSTLYGTTTAGGANGQPYGYGTVFSIPATGGTATTLFSFDGIHGKSPATDLTLSGSTLYGMTRSGGAHNDGVIFSIPVTGGTPTILYDFDGTHGANPEGGLTLSGSTLYGMTYYGGTHNVGTIFSIPVTGGTPTTLFSFDNTHGAYPEYGSLTLSGSTLYGMTTIGGANNKGVIFSIPVAGGTPTTLFDFDGIHGATPENSLTLSGSTLYGMTYSGLSGTNAFGVIFSLPVTGGTPTILFNFDAIHGRNPYNSLTLDGGTLYGMATGGGISGGVGVVFSLAVPEPATCTLLMVGGAVCGIALLSRRQSNSSFTRARACADDMVCQ